MIAALLDLGDVVAGVVGAVIGVVLTAVDLYRRVERLERDERVTFAEYDRMMRTSARLYAESLFDEPSDDVT